MDAVETVGLVKMDILAQGGLAAMRDVKQMLGERGIHVDLERCGARDKSTGNLLLGAPQASVVCDVSPFMRVNGTRMARPCGTKAGPGSLTDGGRSFKPSR